MSSFPGQGSIRTLGLLIDVKIQGGENFDRIQKLISRVTEQVAKINSTKGDFATAITDIQKRQSDIIERPRQLGPDALEAQSSVNKLELARLAIQRQQEAAVLRELKARGDLEIKQGKELSVLSQISSVQAQNAGNLNLVNQLESIRIGLLERQARAKAKVEALTVTRPAAEAVERAKLLSQEGDNVGALSTIRLAQDRVPAGSQAALKLRQQELAILRDIAREEKAADDASQRRAAERLAAQRAIAAVALSEARQAARLGDNAGALGIVAAARAKLTDQATVNRLLEREVQLKTSIARGDITRASLEAKNAAAAGDYARALRLIEETQRRVVAGSAAHLKLEQQKMTVLGQQQQAIAAQSSRTIQQARLLEAQGRRREALALIGGAIGGGGDGGAGGGAGAAGGADDPNRVRLVREHLRLQQGLTREIDGQKGLFGVIGGMFVSFITTLTKIQAVFFVFRATLGLIGNTLNSLIFRPLVGLARDVLTVTDSFRKLEVTFVGIAGSLRASREIVRDIVRAADGLPVTPLQAIEAVRQTAFVPAIATRLNEQAGRQQFANETLRTIVGLGTINPTQGPEGAGFAIREALAGQFRSLRTRFDISPDVVAASIGKRLDDLRRDPELTLKAISGFVNSFVGPEVFQEMQNTLSIQGRRFRGLLERFFKDIGEAKVGDQPGLFDSIVQRFRSFNDSFDAFLSPEVGSQGEADLRLTTQKVSIALQQFIDAIIGLASTLISALSGRQIDLKKAIDENDFKRIGDTFAALIEGLAKLAAFIVESVGSITDAIASVAGIVLKDPAAELRELRLKALGVEDRDGSLFIRGSDRPVASFDRAGRAEAVQNRQGNTFVRNNLLPRLGPDITDRIPASAVLEQGRGRLNEADTRRLQALERRAEIVERFLNVRVPEGVPQDSATTESSPADRLSELGKAIRQRMSSMSQTINVQGEAVKTEDNDRIAPNTIQASAAALGRAIEFFQRSAAEQFQNGALTLQDAIDKASSDVELLSVAQRSSLPSGLPLYEPGSISLEKIDEIRGLIDLANTQARESVRTAVSSQLQSLELRLKDLSIGDQVRESAAFFDDFIAVGQALQDTGMVGPQPSLRQRAQALRALRPESERGGTGFVNIIPDDFAETREQLQAILSVANRVAVKSLADQALERAQGQITLATQKAGGVEDVLGAATRIQQALAELRQVQKLLTENAAVLDANISGSSAAALSAIEKSIDTGTGLLAGYTRRLAEVNPQLAAAEASARRIVEDALFASQERAAERILSEPDRIAERLRLSIEKIGTEAQRQLAELDRTDTFNRLVDKYKGGPQGELLARQELDAQRDAVTRAAEIQRATAESSAFVELSRRERDLLKSIRGQTEGDIDIFLNDRERIIRDAGNKIIDIEEQIERERSQVIIDALEERIGIIEAGRERQLRLAEEARASGLSGLSRENAIKGLLADTQFNISQSGPQGLVGSAPGSIEELNRLFSLIEAKRAAAVQDFDLGLPTGLSNRDALREAIDDIERLRDLTSSPEFKESLTLSGVDPSEFADRFAEALARVREEFDATRKAARDLQNDIGSSIDGTLGDVMIDTIKNRGENLAKIFEDIGLRIVRAFADAAEEVLYMEAFRTFLQGAFRGASGPTYGPEFVGPIPSRAQGGVSFPVSYRMMPPETMVPPLVRAAEGLRANFGILTKPNGLVPLADGRIARTVEDGHPEAFIPLAGGGQAIIPMPMGQVPVRIQRAMDTQGGIERAFIPLPSAPGGRIPVRVIDAATGAYSGGSMPYNRPVVAQPATQVASPAPASRDSGMNLTLINTIDPEAVVRRAAATDPDTFVNPVVRNASGGGAMRRTIRISRRG